jgi:transcriptional regulator with XRE-family HTH domain
MAIGNNIKRIRNLKSMTQKELGLAIGFDIKTADIRIAQYESGTRTPKKNVVDKMAHVLNISPLALTTPDIDTYLGLMHTLFTLEDLYGLKINEVNGEVCLHLDKSEDNTCEEMLKMLTAWQQQSAMLESGEITKEEYDKWRYSFPEFDTTQRWAKVPSQELSDRMVKKLDK